MNTLQKIIENGIMRANQTIDEYDTASSLREIAVQAKKLCYAGSIGYTPYN